MSSAIVCLTKGLVFCTEFKADCFVLKIKYISIVRDIDFCNFIFPTLITK